VVDLINLRIEKVILHEIFKRLPNGDRVAPDCSDEVEDLDSEAITALIDRVYTAMTSSTRCVQMSITNWTTESMVAKASALFDSDSSLFVARSVEVAEKLAHDQKGRNLPGGVLVIFTGTAGVPKRRIVGVIKAEVYNGFMRDRSDNNRKPKMKFLKSLMLTAQTKLYKVGLFCEPTSRGVDEFPSGWEAFIYDDTLTMANRYGAAKYFYDGFLGLGFPESSARLTKQFHDLTKRFIHTLDKPEEEKIILHNALVTYLKADQLPTVGISSFGETYFGGLEIQDSYKEFMTNNGFSSQPINKDVTDLDSSLKLRRITFGNKIKVTGPAVAFDKLVSFKVVDGEQDERTGVTVKWTQVIIKDRITAQE
jgi:hypothetical protein